MKYTFEATKRTAKWAIAIITILTLWSAWQLQHLQISYDFEAFFPKSDQDLTIYRNHINTFGADNDYVLLAVETEHVIDPDFLADLSAFMLDLKTSANIDQVVGLPSIKQMIIGPMGAFEVPLYNLQDFNAAQTARKIMSDKQLVGSFMSEDTTTTALIITTAPKLSKSASDETLMALYQVMEKHQALGKFHIAGRVHGQHHYIDLMFWELLIFGVSSVLLLALFLFIAFRTLWGIVLPLLVVLCTVVWLLGGLSFSGQSISMLTTIMPTILFVVGVSDVIHLLEKYLEELRQGRPKKQALIHAMKEIGIATFLTSLTTSIGFLTLLTADMAPIQDFGIFTAIGVWIAYLITFTLIPAALLLLPTPHLAKNTKGFWHQYLHRCFIWVLRHQKTIMGSTALVFIIALIGASQIQVNNYLLEDLSDDDPVKQEYVFFEEKFDGVRPFEAALVAKNAPDFELTPSLVSDLFLLEDYLLSTYGLKNVMGLHTIVGQLNQATHGGNMDYRKNPDIAEWPSIKKLLLRAEKSNKLKPILNRNTGQMRLTGRIIDYGGKAFREKNEALKAFWATLPSAKNYDLTITGMAYLIDKNNALLSANMLLGLLIAFSLIALIIAFLFKSFRYIVIALIPNMLPLIMVAGFMGFVGIDLKMSTSLIFTIAFGIAVDDTIHFLSRFNLELKAGKSMVYALKRTFLSTGKAIVITSIILCAGFWTLIGSSFMSTFYVGLLISLTLVFAVLSDLLIIPVLILWIGKKNKKN